MAGSKYNLASRKRIIKDYKKGVKQKEIVTKCSINMCMPTNHYIIKLMAEYKGQVNGGGDHDKCWRLRKHIVSLTEKRQR